MWFLNNLLVDQTNTKVSYDLDVGTGIPNLGREEAIPTEGEDVLARLEVDWHLHLVQDVHCSPVFPLHRDFGPLGVEWEGPLPRPGGANLFPLLWLCNEQNPLELVHEVHMVFLEALFGQLGGAIGWHLTQPVSVAVYRPPCVFVLNILHILTRTKTMMNLKQKRQESDVDIVRRLVFDRSSVDTQCKYPVQRHHAEDDNVSADDFH